MLFRSHLPRVDASRLVLNGTSLGGKVSLLTAARFADIRALSLMAPVISKDVRDASKDAAPDAAPDAGKAKPATTTTSAPTTTTVPTTKPKPPPPKPTATGDNPY